MTEFQERFARCEAKIERSYEHLKTLEAEIDAIREAGQQGDLYEVVAEPNPKIRQQEHRVHLLVPIPTDRWGILVGDAAHSARSALDNVVTATLIRKGRRGKPQFPVFHTSREDYLEKGVPRIAAIGKEGLAVVERHQPYNRGSDYRSDLLWLLHKLWNADKHDDAPIVAMETNVVSFQIETRNQVGTLADPIGGLAIGGPTRFLLKEGAIVASVVSDFSAGHKMHVKVHGTPQIVFGDGEPGLGREVAPTVLACIRHAAGILGEFERLP